MVKWPPKRLTIERFLFTIALTLQPWAPFSALNRTFTGMTGRPSFGLATLCACPIILPGMLHRRPAHNQSSIAERDASTGKASRKHSRELSARRHRLYTSANPVIVMAVVKIFGG
jgi:hypothetical protein